MDIMFITYIIWTQDKHTRVGKKICLEQFCAKELD